MRRTRSRIFEFKNVADDECVAANNLCEAAVPARRMNERRPALSQKATGALCRGSRVGCDDLDSAGGTPAVTDWFS